MDIWNILKKSLKQVSNLSSYKCTMNLTSFQNGTKRQKQSYLFRAPGDIIIKQLGPYKKGAIVVISSTGKVRAKGGGLLSFVEIELDRGSSLLKGVTGDSAVESDWVTVLKNILKLRQYTEQIWSKNINIDFVKGFEINLILKKNPYEPYDRYKFILHDDGPVLLVEKFIKNKLINRITWNNIQLNPATSDSDFIL